MENVDGPGIQNSTQEFLKELLRPLLEEAVAEALRSLEIEDNDLLTVDQAAEFLTISKHTVYKLTASKEIPFFKRGKRVYFSRKSLSDWIKGED